MEGSLVLMESADQNDSELELSNEACYEKLV